MLLRFAKNRNPLSLFVYVVDHVNCCGSVLSLIDNSESALTEIRRILKPRGTLFIEVESRWNFDMLWILFNRLLGNKLNYYNSSKDFFKLIFSLPHNNIIVDYPYGNSFINNTPLLIKIKLFTQYSLKKELDRMNFKILKKWNIHGITNLIPSTILHKDNPSIFVQMAFSFLSLLEENINLIPYGNSTAYLLQKL